MKPCLRSPSLAAWLILMVMSSVLLALAGTTLLVDRFARNHAEQRAHQHLDQVADKAGDAADGLKPTIPQTDAALGSTRFSVALDSAHRLGFPPMGQHNQTATQSNARTVKRWNGWCEAADPAQPMRTTWRKLENLR